MNRNIIVLLYNIIGWSLFGLLHSLTATDRFKRFVRDKWPLLFPWYRLIYTVTQTMLFFYLWVILPRPQIGVWQVPEQWYWLFRILQLLSVGFFLWTLRSFRSGEFLGIAQVKRFIQTGIVEQDDEQYQLNISGFYRICRHPLYLFVILIFIFEPVMTGFKAIFTIWLILYIQIGARMEEKRLIARFGETYLDYMRQVSRIFPWKFIKDVLAGKRIN